MCVPLVGRIDLANLAMLFPLAVLYSALRLGRGPAVFSAFLSVATLDFFFVPPHLTLVVSDVQYLLTFLVLLVVALITAQLAAGLREQRDAAERREALSRALNEVASELSAALTFEQIHDIVERSLQRTFGARGRIAQEGARDNPRGPYADERAADRVLPLHAPMRTRGTLSVWLNDPARGRGPEFARFLETFATLVAISLERVHYIAVANQTEIEITSERMRNAMLNALSHDLRTPLTALAGMAETLKMTPPALSEKQMSLVHGLHEQAVMMSDQVAKMLDMARLQSGKLRLRCEWQPIEETVGAALRALSPRLAGHRVRTALEPDLPLVEVDAVLIESALRNLIENAAKYAPAGTTITVTAAVHEACLEVSVEDEGPGLPAGREHELFEMFVRGDASAGSPGAGLGLAIVKAIAEAHGGQVRASPRVPAGARFTLSLPLGHPPQPPGESS